MCRLCNHRIENITHVISGCEKMAARYYLPERHDVVGRTLFNAIRKNNSPDLQKLPRSYSDVQIIAESNFEYWWNVSVKTSRKVSHNKPDIIIWDKNEKKCSIVEISCPADVNVSSKITEKENIYGPLTTNLQLLYPEYRFLFLPIIVGALGTIPKCLVSNIEKLGVTTHQAKLLARKLQIVSISGTVKICKTFMRFSC